MKQIILALLVFSVTFTSCIKEKTAAPLTQKQIQHKIDSVLVDRTKQIQERGQKDLQYRLMIEVKGKADSMVRALHEPKKDSVKPPKI